MNLFSWIRRWRENRNRADWKITLSAKAVMEDDISKIRCLACNCYFNQVYKGTFSCDLKQIQIDDTGRCQDFCDQSVAMKTIRQQKKGEASK